MNGVISVKFTNEATVEPVDVEDVKVPLEIDGTYHDGFLSDLITTARQMAEKYLNRPLIARTVEATIVNESGGQLLPYGVPSGSITVKNEAGDNVDAEITGTGDFRYLQGPTCGPLTVSYEVEGYTSTTLPKVLKMGIIQAVVFWFENRGDGQMRLPAVSRATMKYERIKDDILFY